MATTSAPHESLHPHGRPGNGAAAARTEQLFAEYGRTVNGLCRALLRDHAEAEDAAQQTFLSAHRALANGSEPREPAAWLATIARNECWARIRTRMREPLPVEELETASTTNDPLTEAIHRADLAALWSAIEALPRQQRDALLLREFGGLSYGELAAALAVSGPAVESLLFRARQSLRGQLRTVYASISGASWIEALVRLFVGGGAPVAAKVAVLGVGAAALGGSAVVVPHVFDNHRPSHSTSRTPAAVEHRSLASPAPALVLHAGSPQAPVPARAQPTPAPIVRVSSEQETKQHAMSDSQPAPAADHGSEHAARAESSNEHAVSGGGGDGGGRLGSGSDQTGDGGDGGSSAGDGSSGGSSDGSSDGSSSATIPELPAVPPAPTDGGG